MDETAEKIGILFTASIEQQHVQPDIMLNMYLLLKNSEGTYHPTQVLERFQFNDVLEAKIFAQQLPTLSALDYILYINGIQEKASILQ